jgi:cyclic beta-1,2-glucan synthetase
MTVLGSASSLWSGKARAKIRSLRAINGWLTARHQPDDELIRAELFSVERLEQHAESLAAAQPVTPKSRRGRKLTVRLKENAITLRDAYLRIGQAIREDRTITPAAEWLLDNFPIVEAQIRDIWGDLPPSFYRELPKLAEGPLEGYPRVFGLAWAFVAHTDSRFDLQMLVRFVRAYQRVQPLTIGELWAVAITLRIALVENLRRAAEGIANRLAARREADALADRLLGVGDGTPEAADAVLQQFDEVTLPTAFAVQLVQRLRDQDPRVTPALLWLDRRLAAQGTTADEAVRAEHQRQAATNVTVRNVITSMRLISAVDWTEFFEEVSLVDTFLAADSEFGEMDFASRNLYRRAIEELSRGSRYSELEVAERAAIAARQAAAKTPTGRDLLTERERDPGYYLISSGRRAFENELGFRPTTKNWFARLNAGMGLPGYLAIIAIIGAFVLAMPLAFLAYAAGVTGWPLIALAVIGLFPAFDAAVALVNRDVTLWLGPTLLPGLELRDGVPSSLRTIIVMPTLLTTRAAVEEQIERLEVHHLSSLDGDLRYALLSDWTDSASETAAGDEELLAAAVAAIERLNRRYEPPADGNRFILLHRRRVWNKGEGKWIGWERKRGKLHELNRLLRGATDTTFLPLGGRPPIVPTGVRYVITLDADTRLPRGTAKRLIGKMAHPLNRPILDPRTRLVIAGHAVLQPRVTPSLPIGREGSLFQSVFSSPSGIDPYAAAVSDVYQDLFGEGSYVGKGIYDLDAFEAALEGRIPENAVLSHDLLEGIFARAGLVSDIEVVEEFPSRYDVAAARQHRWARGDWQLLPWIFGRARRPNGQPTTVPVVGRWKMIDNLRRSLSAPIAILALLAGWMLPVTGAIPWSLYIVSTIALPALLPLVSALMPRRRGIPLQSQLRSVGADLALALIQVGFLVIFLAHQAWLMADAVSRTLFRLFVRRRRLLEWVTAAQAKFNLRPDLFSFVRQMAGGAAFAVFVALVIEFAGQGSRLVAAPFVILWMLSPAIARWASLPPPIAGHVAVSPAEANALRLIARRTWRFFDTFVGPEDHMLPPDNFQEDPKPVVAHRTSPTNLGLYLLSVIAARDFGWIGTLEMVERLEATLTTMDGLERFRGHFYNWYDTRDFRPLDPKYVSSVDSGNLAGHLIALANACREVIGRPIAEVRCFDGVGDAVALARLSLRELRDDRGTPTVTRKQLDDALDALEASLRHPPTTPRGVAGRLNKLADLADTVTDIARTLSQGRGDRESAEALIWAEAIHAAVRSHLRDLSELLPWTLDTDASSERDIAPDRRADPLRTMPSLGELAHVCETRRHDEQTAAQDSHGAAASAAVLDALPGALAPSGRAAASLERRLTALAERAATMFEAMKFDFLFEPGRQLLSIGYRVADRTLDPNCYDLLASEARLTSFVAIAKGDIPTRHWFRLGRALAPVHRRAALISWSGSMFEYLMPALVMRAPIGSLLEQTSQLVVRRQIDYGAERKVPWGVSESAYNARDLDLTYQYSDFGIPDLGFKRGLGDNVVIAAYATGLAAMVDPAAASRNFARLAAIGGRGSYGWYESLDYTAARLPEGVEFVVVRAFMAHHQGMTLVAIANVVHDGAMRARFHAEPIIQATELLLQERTPRDVAIARARVIDVKATAKVRDIIPPMQRRYKSPHARLPHTHLLSNGNYAVMLTGAGSGYSRWRDLAVTRWREDPTCDGWGAYVFLRDIASGEVWSAGYQPSGVAPDDYDIVFSEGRAEIIRRDGTITTTLEVAVSPEDDAEVRRVSITNHGSRARQIELTSYAEIVLAPHATDAAHPAFAKLFVETEFVAGPGALLATRRPRSPDEIPVWAAHVAVVEGETEGDVQFETDRARFLGRGRGVRTPISIIDGWPLSNTAGAVLDPIFSLRRRVRLPRGATVRIAFWTLIAPSRSAALDLADKHHDAMAYERAITLAWTQAQVQLHHLGISADEANLFQRLANRVLFSDPTLRPPSDVLTRGARDVSALWAQGISGDLPVVLLRIDDADDFEIARQLLRAHEYWRMKQLAVDLVILNEKAASYVQDLQTGLEALVRVSNAQPKSPSGGARGSVFVLRADLASPETLGLLQSAARVVLLGGRGSLAEQIKRLPDALLAAAPPSRPALPSAPPAVALRRPTLEFFNGLGGFAERGREYVTILDPGQSTPAPWINVIANPTFGFHVSVEGSGYTWSINSQENQLTPWSNDPVADPPGEVIYLRDQESGDVWGPTALPIREDSSSYVARHGQGYSRFEHESHEIALELLQFVPVDDPVKISRLRIRNRSERTRRLSVTAYAEWVLGTARGGTGPFIFTEIDAETGALLAQNPWSIEFGQRIAFADLSGRQLSWTGDRTEFLGRNGALSYPAALASGSPLSNRVGAGLDPCAALQTSLELEPDGVAEIVFLLGQTASKAEARAVLKKYRSADLEAALAAVGDFWDDTLGVVQVRTPDRAMDIVLNRWLPYQTLACRVWARAAFYQASGAYGFRDQLQDVMALCVAKPELTREHLLRAAGRQFVEGDMQHWWLPTSGRGVRTRVSDDSVWLQFVVAHYVEVTGDVAVLDELVPFLQGPPLPDDQSDAFFQPTVAAETATLFEHCARALDRSLAVGDHGLPLMGGGDWNDGMNRVGERGKGESVWLGWFLYATLSAFEPLAERRDDRTRTVTWRRHAVALADSLEREAWDGDWYRRAYFDDGTPLGSVSNGECRIDSIAQSWSVISGAGDPARAARAMAAVDKYLVRRNDELVLLFTPPFDRSALDPGYIKGYPPGIRENGGQYTHAALWSVLAFAMLGDGDKACELFSMLNPINHANTRAAVQRYKVEPYVACADIYSTAPHIGRGGWTWYTGSAGWMYRVGLESILGFRLQGATLVIDPCVPKAWPGFEIAFRYRTARYDIAVENPNGVSRGVIRVELDGETLPGPQARVTLADDGATHRVLVVLG